MVWPLACRSAWCAAVHGVPQYMHLPDEQGAPLLPRSHTSTERDQLELQVWQSGKVAWWHGVADGG
jgi:hypothetical protein